MGKNTGQRAGQSKGIGPEKSPQGAPDSVLNHNRQLKRRIFDFHTILELSRNFNAVLDLKALLNSFIDVLSSQLKVEKAAVFQVQSDNGKKFILACWRDNDNSPSRSLFDRESVVVKMLRHSNSAVNVGDVLKGTKDKYEKLFLQNFQNGLAVPLHGRIELNGMLFVGPKSDKSEFTDEDAEFLSILSSQIAVAVENARLYEAEKKAIAELQSTQEQLVHTEKLAALGEMSAKIAHEINNPLGIIKNYLMLISKAQKDPTQSFQYLEIVGQEIDRITNIVKELLQFHKPSNVDYRRINVLNVLEDVMMFLEPQLVQTNIKFSRRFAPDCPEVEASAENLKQVFINVFLNAVDAMPEGGTIEAAATNYKENLKIQIKDSGPGVSEEMIPRIFEPFFTTKEEGKGTGLGLSVCYGIIKKHQGRIEFKNLKSGGCVEIELPGIGKKNE